MYDSKSCSDSRTGPACCEHKYLSRRRNDGAVNPPNCPHAAGVPNRPVLKLNAVASTGFGRHACRRHPQVLVSTKAKGPSAKTATFWNAALKDSRNQRRSVRITARADFQKHSDVTDPGEEGQIIANLLFPVCYFPLPCYLSYASTNID